MHALALFIASLAVSRLVSGNVTKVGSGHLANLKLINSARGAVENRVSMKWDADPAALSVVVAAAAQELVLAPTRRRPAPLEVSGLLPGAIVLVHARPVTLAPARPIVPGLDIGPHTLEVAVEDYHRSSTAFVAKSGESVHVVATMQAIEHPFYTRLPPPTRTLSFAARALPVAPPGPRRWCATSTATASLTWPSSVGEALRRCRPSGSARCMSCAAGSRVVESSLFPSSSSLRDPDVHPR